jgi:hypothetical protein
VLPLQDFLEAPYRLLNRHVFSRGAGELLGDVERLRAEPLNAAGTVYGELVLLA